MNRLNTNVRHECPRAELVAYIDGELTPRAEIELETHLADCRLCVAEFNEQKRLLFALDFALEAEKEFALPANFAKVVIANAESGVSGLRCPQERYRAVFVIAALLLMFLTGLGSETKTIAGTFIKLGEQLLTVATFAVHLVFDIAVAVSIVARSVCSQFIYGSAFSAVLFAVLVLTALLVLLHFGKRFSQT